MIVSQIPASEITLDTAELKRRLGEDYAATLEKYGSAVKEITSGLTVRYSIGEVALDVCDEAIAIGDIHITSAPLGRHLTGYKKVAVVALTLGVDADRLIRRYSVTGQTLGFVVDALLSVIADSACLDICSSKVIGDHTAPFAIGYADTDTKYLPSLLKIADPKDSLGITFTDSYLMIPTKSIVVIVGKM